MSTVPHSHKDSDADVDSIYNSIIDGLNETRPSSNRTVITIQPNRAEDRCTSLFPIIMGSSSLPILPLYGIQLLSDVHWVQIQQTVYLNDLFSMVESENNFVVKSGDGDVLYGGKEGSPSWQRILFGSSRRFILRLFDRANQEACFFIRRLAPTNPIYSCYLQRMDIFIPPCDFIGSVQQKWTTKSMTLQVKNYINENLFEVQGPLCPCCSEYKDIEFEVIEYDVSLCVSKISYMWEESKSAYVLNILFFNRLDYKKKTLILACAFLLEYIYFLTPNSSGCCLCIK